MIIYFMPETPLPPASPNPPEVNAAPIVPAVSHKSKLTPFLVILLIVAAVSVGSFLLAKSLYTSKSEPTTLPSPVTQQPTPTANWKTYTNTHQGYYYTIQYPKEAEINSSEVVTSIRIATKDGQLQIIIGEDTQGSACANYSCDDQKEINVTIGNKSVNTTRFWPYKDNLYAFETSSIHPYSKTNLQFIGYYPTEEYLTQINQILSTFKFTTEVVTPSPMTNNYTTLNYFLPEGWINAKDINSNIEVGYNPATYRVQPYENRVDINPLTDSVKNYNLNIRGYDGESRHEFIRKSISDSWTDSLDDIKTASSYEKEYLISNKSSLIIYNVNYTGACTVGMITIDSNRAIYLRSYYCDHQSLEPILKTIKILK